MNTLDAATARQVAQSSITDLTRWVTRILKERQTIAAGRPVARPASKDSKHRAYGAAGQIIRTLRLDVPRPNSVEDLQVVLAAAARWTPAQYDAAEERTNLDTAKILADQMNQTANLLRSMRFEADAEALEAVAGCLRSEVAERRRIAD